MRLDVPATSSTTTTTTTFLPPQQKWNNRSRSGTEPVIIGQDASLHKIRSSVDESPHCTRRTSPERAPPSVTHPGDNSVATGQHSPTRKPPPPRSSTGPLPPPISLPNEVPEVIPTPNTPNGNVIPSSISHFKAPNNPSSIAQRSPPQKRPPASRSSHGVETSTGPPPAISTQRTYSQDKIWQPILPIESAAPPSPSSKQGSDIQLSNSPPSSNDSSVKDTANTSPTDSHESSSTPSRNNSIKEEGKKMTMTTRYMDDTANDDPDRTIRGLDAIIADQDSVATGSDKSQPRNEDVFLNIARATSGRQTAAERAERRRSRIHGADRVTRDYSTNSPTNSPQVQLAASEIGDETPTLQEPVLNSDRPSMFLLHDNFNRRSSLQPRSSAVSAHPLDDAGRMRYFDHGSRSSFGYSRSRLGRDGSPESPKSYDRRVSAQDPARAYRQSNLSATRNNRMVSGQEFMEEPSPPEEVRRLDGTESTMSTTATSTVWDELDDLKSRIRKLELTGKLPSSSAAAMSNINERPRTATTTITTMSSSPKQGRKSSSSPAESTVAGLNSSVQPLLTSALGKVKPVLSKEVYRALEATTADAISLSSVFGHNTPQSSTTSTIGGSTPFERQIRRKADSMCRSLTELCLALSENDQTISIPKQRPVSRDTTMSHLGGNSSGNSAWGLDGASRYQKGAGHEPEERPRTSSRVPSRLEARRTSMLLGSQPQQTQSSPITASDRYDTQSQTPTFSPSTRPTTNRSSTVLLRSRRGPESVVGTPDDNTEYVRPVSRAMTEITPTARTPPHHLSRISTNTQRASREYTSQHPLPANTSSQRSPSLVMPSSIPPPRSYLSAIPNPNSSTSTSNIQPGNRRYASRYLSGPMVSSGASEVGKQSGSGSRLTVTATGAASQTSINGNGNRHVNRRSIGYGNGNGTGTRKGAGNMGVDGAADMDTDLGDKETSTRKRGISTSSVKSRKENGKTLSREEVPQLPALNAQMAREGEI